MSVILLLASRSRDCDLGGWERKVDRRHQVFVSSTFQDLVEERKEIIQALLELDCIPSGMEIFPAANEDQWTLIKKLIDDCDYYLVVVAGRYGSLGPEGISYTEMEYRYALERGKPIVGFVRKNIGDIPSKYVDKDEEIIEKQRNFLALVQSKMVKYWSSPQELGSVASRSLVQLIKSHPMPGWVRANDVPDEAAAIEILKLRNVIDDLRSRLNEKNIFKSNIEHLSQGDDAVEIYLIAKLRDRVWHESSYRLKRTMRWNNIFGYIAPILIDECDELRLANKINELLSSYFRSSIESELASLTIDGRNINDIICDPVSFDTIIVQFFALSLIAKSNKSRSVKDKSKYYILTDFGEKLMYELRAKRK